MKQFGNRMKQLNDRMKQVSYITTVYKYITKVYKRITKVCNKCMREFDNYLQAKTNCPPDKRQMLQAMQAMLCKQL